MYFYVLKYQTFVSIKLKNQSSQFLYKFNDKYVSIKVFIRVHLNITVFSAFQQRITTTCEAGWLCYHQHSPFQLRYSKMGTALTLSLHVVFFLSRSSRYQQYIPQHEEFRILFKEMFRNLPAMTSMEYFHRIAAKCFRNSSDLG